MERVAATPDPVRMNRTAASATRISKNPPIAEAIPEPEVISPFRIMIKAMTAKPGAITPKPIPLTKPLIRGIRVEFVILDASDISVFFR